MPKHPNFLRIKQTTGGDVDGVVVDIGALDDDVYTQFEHQYIESMRQHWLKRKKSIDGKP